MKFNKIDLENWKRRKAYTHFMSQVPCTYSMSVNLDITYFQSKIAEKKIKLFPSILYGITHIVNKHEEFRMNFNEYNELGYYDSVNPSFTAFHEKNEMFSNVWIDYSPSFEKFYNNYLEDIKICKDSMCDKPEKGKNIFTVSCIPWVSFTGFNLNLKSEYNYLPPIFTIGKFFVYGNQTLLPLAIQVHHAVCDGFHTARFVNELQEWFNSF